MPLSLRLACCHILHSSPHAVHPAQPFHMRAAVGSCGHTWVYAMQVALIVLYAGCIQLPDNGLPGSIRLLRSRQGTPIPAHERI